MTTQSKENIMKYWPLVVGILMLTGTWASIQSHMSNDAIHINENEVVLTNEEYKSLLKFATIVQDKYPTIEINKDRIIKLEKYQAVHETEYKNLFAEHEGLETKSSREDSRLNEKINEIHE